MCLVSYIPTEDGFCISSNRDEAPNRVIDQIAKFNQNESEIICPLDIKGGSWIFASSNNKIAVVLNGALRKHSYSPPYRLSRGLMLKSYFEYENTAHFVRNFDFAGIEPFTSLLYDNGRLTEFRWDGVVRHIEILKNTDSHIYSSSTLYSEQLIEKRKAVFQEMMSKQKTLDAESIKFTHLNGKVDDAENDFIMNRDNRVRTVSFTQVCVANDNLTLQYKNLINNAELKDSLQL